MPVRSLNSSVFKWPDASEVDRAVRTWASKAAGAHTELVWLAYFGSYARGDWGVGSDLDLIAVVQTTEQPFHRRALTWDLKALPVPADLLIYTVAEWENLRREGGRFAITVQREAIPVFRRDAE